MISMITPFKRFLYSTLTILLCSMYVMATDTLLVVRGYVYDAADHIPLANVNIVETSMQAGTSTDVNGFFRLRLSSANVRLRITHVAYTDRKSV
ncbi:hypothetical protein EZS27_032301 [termite gut metagenome]|uniref:TonB-dependent receptor SusC n=1 Tax=termite gut metagenome TaxID=433724 RepID=A0A5J4QA23_9ZZZZ